MIPAGFWRRYAAWSLDATPLLLVACVATATQLRAMHADATRAMHVWSDSLVTVMLRLFDQTEAPLIAMLSLLHDPALHAGSREVSWAVMYGTRATLAAFDAGMLLLQIVGEQTRWQGSPGKRLLRIVVVDTSGQSPSLACSLVRNLAGGLSWLTLNLGHALAALPPDHRALHDRIAGTRVLASSPALPRWAQVWLWAQAVLSLILLAGLSNWMLHAFDAAFVRALL